MASEFEPFGETYIKNSYDFYKRARREEPIFFDPKYKYWVVLNYSNIIEIFRNPKIFSAALARHPVTELYSAAGEVHDNFIFQLSLHWLMRIPSLVNRIKKFLVMPLPPKV